MNGAVAQTVVEIETLGVEMRLEVDRVVMRFPDEELREQLDEQLKFLRGHREEVRRFLRGLHEIPDMPCGVRLLSWSLKKPPVAIDSCSVVTEPARFARTTLEQLEIALKNPERWVGWTIPQMLDRLKQVGVLLVLDVAETGAAK